MKKLICILSLFLLVTISAFAQNVEPRYAVGMVSGFNDNSRTAWLDVTSIVPSPIYYLSHYFSADTVIGQECPAGQPCYDVMRREYSPYSTTGYNLTRFEPDGHTGVGRNPRVEGYKDSRWS